MMGLAFLISSQFSSSAAISTQNSSRTEKHPACQNVIVSDIMLLTNSNRPIFTARRFTPSALIGAVPTAVRHFSTTNARSADTTSTATSAPTPPSTAAAEAASTADAAKPNLV